MELNKYKLGECLELQRGYDLTSSQMQGGKVAVVGSNGIIGYHNSERGNSPCITVGRSGSVGKVHYYEQPTWAHNTALFIKDFKGNNPKYLYYLLKNLHLDNTFEKGSSVIPSLDRNLVHSLVVPFHKDINDQRKIVTVLSAIDRKIELNRQINDNLEAMAKQLYDYWFVQFDFPNEEGKPYKSSGGAMVWNEKLKREIPQGWSVLSVNDIAASVRGVSYTKEDMVDSNNGVLVLRGNNIQDNHLIYDSNVAYIPSSFVSEDQRIRPLDIIMTMSSGSKEHIGKSAMFQFASEDTFGAFLTKFTAKEHCAYLLFNLFNSQYFKAKIKSIACGTGINNLTNQTFDEIYIVTPEDELLLEFDKRQSQIFAEIGLIEKSNVELTKQRDELLPLLMNGQATVNYHLSASFLSSLILYRDQYKFYDMKETIIQTVLDGMRAVLTENQLDLLTDVTRKALSECEITPKATEEEQRNKENVELLGAFISSKKVEGCSDKTIHYYKSSIEKLIAAVKKNVCDIATNDIRCYLADQQEQRGLSKVTIDNLRRIYSSFFSWLEDEDYITKSPVRRIHKVRTDALVKEVLTDENIEVLRDSCHELRDIAMIDLLLSTGMRVGELVKINRDDIDFQERQCVVFGKGNKEREVYFNARTKIHLKKYLEQRTDTNPALFVSLHEPHTRLTISGVEVRLRQLGKRVNLNKVHPHKFRRTLATMAIDKGMPIEQVQKMLGHVKIDTTLHYAMVNQTNVKIAHRKFLN